MERLIRYVALPLVALICASYLFRELFSIVSSTVQQLSRILGG